MEPTTRTSVADDIELLDRKLKQLKNEYEQYLLGSRPREPAVLRSEVQKLVALYSNQPIQNSMLRFRFNNLCARFFAFKRRWDQALRQIEEGTYERHVFRARLNARTRDVAPSAATSPAPAPTDKDDLFEAYVTARRRCGEQVKGLTPERLQEIVERQREAIQRRYGCQEVRFRVVIEDGRAKLKASPVPLRPS